MGNKYFFSSIFWKKKKNHPGFSIILFLPKGDEASELSRIQVKSKHVQMQDVNGPMLSLRICPTMILPKTLLGGLALWNASLIDVCTSVSRSSHTLCPLFLEREKKKIKARCIVLFIRTCHETQLFLLLTHFSCHKAQCCSFAWMWKELWCTHKPSYAMNKTSFCVTKV